MDHRWKYPLEVFTFLAVAAVLLLSNVGQSAEESFIDRCRAYAKDHDILPPRMEYEPFQSEELMKLLASGTVDEWKKALADDDPKVRTLGILAIGLGDNPSFLPLLKPSLTDHSRTFDFDASIYLANTILDEKGKQVPKPEVQDLATVAGRMVYEWTGIARREAAEEFDEYWRKVTNPESLVSVWRCRLERAGHRGWITRRAFWDAAKKELHEKSPGRWFTPEEETLMARKASEVASGPIREVKRRMETELPPDLQAVTALAVESRSTAYSFWTNEERSEVANKHLTRDFAFACLRRNPPFDDPYLSPDALRISPYRQFCARLLHYMEWEPKDADLLLQLEANELKRQDRPIIIAQWVLAAARAQDSKDESIGILKDALARATGHYKYHIWLSCMREIWDIAGADEADYLVDQYYLESQQPRISWSRRFLLQRVAESRDKGKVFMGRLLRDKRFKSITLIDIKDIAPVCNQLARYEIIPQKEIHNLGHSIGVDIFSTKKGFEEAKAKYLEETASVLKAVEDWRKWLMEYVEEHDW